MASVRRAPVESATISICGATISSSGARSPFIILLGEGTLAEDNTVQNSGASRLWGGSNNVFRNNEIENGIHVGHVPCHVGGRCLVVGPIACTLDMGIHVNGETDTAVIGHTVSNVVGEGIVVSDLVRQQRDTSADTRARCFAPPFVNPPATGVFETLGATGTDISDNEITQNGLDGIKLVDATDSSVVDNEIEDNFGDGIELTGSDSNETTDNEIEGNRGNGLFIDSSNNNLITDNEIEECGLDGIVEIASAGNVFADNDVEDCP